MAITISTAYLNAYVGLETVFVSSAIVLREATARHYMLQSPQLAIMQHARVGVVVFDRAASECALLDSGNEHVYRFALSSLLIRLPSDLNLADKKIDRRWKGDIPSYFE